MHETGHKSDLALLYLFGTYIYIHVTYLKRVFVLRVDVVIPSKHVPQLAFAFLDFAKERSRATKHRLTALA